MNVRVIEWHGAPMALLVESDDGSYLIPPLILNTPATLEGAEVLRLVVAAASSESIPIFDGGTPGILATIDRAMAELPERLGVPVRRLPDWRSARSC